MLVGVTNGSAASGAPISIAPGNDTAAQCFTFTHISDGFYSIVSYASGLALTVSGTSVSQTTWAGTASQLWSVIENANGTYCIVNQENGRYLDVAGAFTAAGTRVGVWNVTGNANQAFALATFSPEHALEDGSYRIGTAMSASLAVDVVGETSADGAGVCLWAATGTATQVFDVTYLGNGYYSLIDEATGKALDVAGGSVMPGASVIQYRALGSENQQWAITSAGDGTYRITSRSAGIVLDVSGASTTLGTRLGIWTNNGGANQRFTFSAASAPASPVADGIYTVTSALTSATGSKLVLDISGNSSANGAALGLWTPTDANNQKFQISSIGNGCYLIEAVSSLKALDVADGGTASGTPVIQYSTHGGMNQRWLIVDSGKTDSTGEKLYAIISAGNGLAMDVAGGAGTNAGASGSFSGVAGAAVTVQAVSYSDAQLFTIGVTQMAATIADGTYTIASALNTGMAIDVAGGSAADGANIDLYTYNFARNQRYTFTHVGDDYYTIVACSSGMALAATGTAAGSNVCQTALSGADSQLWRADANPDGSYTFVNKACRLVLEIEGYYANAGANIDAWTANGGANQRFVLEASRALADGVYTIASALDPSYVADIAGGSRADGAAAEIYAYNGGRNQRFRIVSLGGGYYKVLSMSSGTGALTVGGTASGSAADGTSVIQSTFTGATSQQWLIKDAGDGYFTFVSRVGDKALDVAGGVATNGAALVVEAAAGAGTSGSAGSATATSQRFALTKVASSSGVIVIDAGHQAEGDYSLEPVGPGSSTLKYKVSGGASGSYTHVAEYQVNLDVALKLQADLEAQGFTVYMVRTTNDVDISNAQRALLANRYNADLFIRIHCDSSNNSGTSGFLTLYPAASGYTAGIAAESYRAASIMHSIIVSEMGARDRGLVSRSDLTGFNWCTVPSVLFELGLMSNYSDDYNLVNPNYQQRMADAICDATVAYMQQR